MDARFPIFLPISRKNDPPNFRESPIKCVNLYHLTQNTAEADISTRNVNSSFFHLFLNTFKNANKEEGTF